MYHVQVVALYRACGYHMLNTSGMKCVSIEVVGFRATRKFVTCRTRVEVFFVSKVSSRVPLSRLPPDGVSERLG